MFHVHTEYLDAASGFHVIELRNEHGARHMVQVAVGHASCPACGSVHLRDEHGQTDPKAMVARAIEALNASERQLAEYAREHRLAVKTAHRGDD